MGCWLSLKVNTVANMFNRSIMILAVVKRTEGAADSLTREQLKLDASHLCVGSEIKDEKSLNDSLMSALHEQACKTHAK